MDRLRGMEVFVAVAELGGFAAAARKLALSPPAVTRAVAGLEDRLGTRLFVRTTRSLRLTDSGARFLIDCRRLLAELAEAEEAAAGSHAAPRGRLRITAPVLFGRSFVAPIVGTFLDRYPDMTCQTLFVDRVADLMDEGLDVAVRIGSLPDSGLTAIRVGSVRSIVVAAPAYVAAHGTPADPAALSAHRMIHALAMGAAPEWRFVRDGRPLGVPLPARLQMNTNDAVLALARAGWGIARLLSYQVAADLAAGRLLALLTDFEPPALPIHVVHLEGRAASRKVRAFVDHAVARLRAEPALA